MTRLRRSLRARAAITSAGALIGLLFAALGLTACGSSGTSATEGGTLNVLTPSFTDFEDPQLGYEATGWEARYNVYIPFSPTPTHPAPPGPR